MNPKKPRLCLIYCGGTIGMVRDADGVARPPRDAKDFLNVAPRLGERYELDFVPLFNKDSTDITPADWSLLAQTIHARMNQSYAGIVVVHGTDTMAYTASAVALALGATPLPMPVVFTGAMRTADDPQPDGPQNLGDACLLATQHVGEVLIVFGGTILRGCRASKRFADRLEAFISPSFPAYGEVRGDAVIANMQEVFRTAEPGPVPLRAEFADGVLPMTLHPGLDAKWFGATLDAGGVAGVLLQGLGNANVPTAEPAGWLDFIREATRRDVPVALVSPLVGASAERTVYAGGQAALDAGAIDGGNLTAECAWAKLSWVIAQAKADGGAVAGRVREMMQQVYVGEMD